MTESVTTHSWLGPGSSDIETRQSSISHELIRQWQGFMTARLVLGFMLVTLLAALQASGAAQNKALIAISLAYLAGTLASKMFIQPRPLGQSFNRVWGALVGIDLLTFSALQMLQDGPGNSTSINYTPLFALPLLLASVLGSLRLALGTAAGITMLILGGSILVFLRSPVDSPPYFVQPALSGAGYFAIAWLSNQLASRLATEGLRASQSQLAASIQRQVNSLVIESLPDGVLIVDDRGRVHAANPSARHMLGSSLALHAMAFDLKDEPGWRPLLDLTRRSVGTSESHEEDVVISHGGQGPRRLHARTRLAAPHGNLGESLCVLFLQDQRELEARMRTEKLAGMGRMSTAVAHEIRNPLAAISQANALLDEDITDPKLKKLTAMVGQNAKRLEKIVNDILNISRIQPYDESYLIPPVELKTAIHRICQDWAAQSGCADQLKVTEGETAAAVRFDSEHLRRVMVNLLDNARRHTTDMPESIQVTVSAIDTQRVSISVWSDAPPMDQSVERHLFEPFFSSDSRSSGLGLFICRELCERNDASLIYQRNIRMARENQTEGNDFLITLNRVDPPDNAATAEISTTPWQVNP